MIAALNFGIYKLFCYAVLICVAGEKRNERSNKHFHNNLIPCGI